MPWDPDDEMGPAWGRSPPGWRAGAEALGWGSLWTQEGRTVGSPAGNGGRVGRKLHVLEGRGK